MEKIKSGLSRNARAKLCVIGSALILMATGGSIYGASSMTVAPAAVKFGVTTAETGMYSSFWTIGLVIAAFTGGHVLNRVNLNGSAIIGGIIGAAGLLLMGFSPNIYGYYFGAALTGFPIAWTGPALLQTAISRWFYTGRATVIGVVGMTEAIGTTCISFLTTHLVEANGVSAALIAAACVCLAGNLVAGLFFLKGVPEDYGYTPVGAEKIAVADNGEVLEIRSLTQKEAFRKPYFWMFLISMAVINIGYAIAYPQLSAYSQYLGYTAAQAAVLVSVWSWGKGLSKIAYGLLGDKFGLRFSLCLFAGVTIITGILYIFFSSYGVLLVCAAGFGIIGGLTGSGTLGISRMVGPKEFLKMALLPHGFNSIGYFFGPIIFRVIYDGTMGAYRLAWALSVVFLVGYFALIFFSLKKENMCENET